MHILIVGAFNHAIYEQELCEGFSSLDINVSYFEWSSYFDASLASVVKRSWRKAQNKFLIGPILSVLNRKLKEQIVSQKPDLIFLYRNTHIFPRTISEIKRSTGCQVYSYNNDDPFSVKIPRYYYRHYFRSLSFCDHVFVYREKNIKDMLSIGVDSCSVLMPYYSEARNYPVSFSAVSRYACDVIFIGHYEPDGRDEVILFLLQNSINLSLYGTGWEASPLHLAICNLLEVDSIVSIREDYNEALSSAKIALVFLSKINSDDYTRRCFEIPACKTAMLAEQSIFLMKMYQPNVEAVYFDTKESCLFHIRRLLENDLYKKIASNGFMKLHSQKHEVTDRCREILEVYNMHVSNKLGCN